jgi:uncharacterized protein DUF1592/uncharacterized protein DUF1588/uncharacterized protein DUF1585/uncharacterized protein DUF1587/uncharacterized protein DUF1595
MARPNVAIAATVVAVAATVSLNVALGAAAQGSAASASPSQVLASDDQALIRRYCLGCHNDRLKTGNLTLESISVAPIGSAPAVWEKVVRKVKSGAMPPAGMPRPEKLVKDGFAGRLETALDHAAARWPNPGRSSVHRLNRAEYGNAIRDLLALDTDVSALLPADDSAYGFDNNADMLTMSTGLLERYLSAASKISRLAVGDLTLKPAVEFYDVSRYLVQDDRMSDDLPFGTRGGLAARHYFPLDAEYSVRVHLQRRRPGQEIDVRLDGQRIKTFVVPARNRVVEEAEGRSDEADMEVRIPVRAGARVISVSLVKKAGVPEGLGPAQLPVANITFGGRVGAETGIEKIEVGGPYGIQGPGDTPSRRQIFTCRPPERASGDDCARQILTRLARHAYRHPPSDKDVRRLLEFYRDARGGFDAGIQAALERLLVDPQFLFRIERDARPAGGQNASRLTDYEIASRLSFFLWSSIPDAKLLAMAERGQLKTPASLKTQARRLLADSRSIALVRNFAAQWLYLRNVQAAAPDVNAFPAFDDNLRQAFQRETELFVASQLRDDQSVVNLLTADYTFVNERLARHYGIPNVYGSHFRRVTLPDETRRGLLGQGSILMVTSYATRTSPVVRGKWLLENILGAPPPAPPPDVPDLPEQGDGGRAVSVRERMEKHRSNPACASCHAQMDPLGFALENFDAVGRWRTLSEGNTPIDASGALPDGTTFDGPAELRRLLAGRRDEFVRTVIEKMLVYALGRGLEYYDMPTVRRIQREAAAADYRWSSLVQAIVQSTPFQMRRSEP